MAKWVAALSLIFFSSLSMADVNSNVANCLTSNSNSPGSKAACVQAAIGAEETNQITTLFQIYSNFVNQEINSNRFGSAPSGGNRIMPRSGAPASTIFAPNVDKASPGQSQQQTPPPPPVSTTPKQTPQGGIQYY